MEPAPDCQQQAAPQRGSPPCQIAGRGACVGKSHFHLMLLPDAPAPSKEEIIVFHRQRRILGAALGIAMSMVLAEMAHAQTTWVGDVSQDWNVAANWSSDPADPTGNFQINTDAAGVFPIYSADGFFAPVDIFIGNVAGANGRLDQTGGNLATGGPNWLRMGEGGGATGTFNLSGGTFTGRVHMARVSGIVGTATINVSNGATLNSPMEVVANDGQNGTATAQGTLNVTGAGTTLLSEGDLIGSWNGNASSFGEINIGAGATVNVATATKRWLIMNRSGAAQGRLNINGGTLNLNAVTDLRFSTNGSTGVSSVTLNSGAINGQAGSELDFNRGGTVGVNNTVNLNGGVLTIGRVMRFNQTAGAATRVFNFNGGTLRAAGAAANFFDADTATLADVQAGGAIIDSNGFDISMGQVLSGVGGLTKVGAGTLALTGANTYAGPTAVNAGTLNVAGLATSGVTVASGAGFGGSGAVSGTTTISGSTLANTNTATPLTLGGLTLGAAGNTINLNLGAGPGVAVTGALTTGGNTATINATKAVWTNGLHNLISFGSFSGALGNFTLAPVGLNARQIAGPLTNTGTGLAVTISGDNPRWTGASSGVWSTAVVANPKNWQLITGGGNVDYLEGDAVVFDDLATGTTTVDITSPTGVAPTSVAFNNSTKAYTINASGGGGIGGTSSLTKDGTNSVTINSANSYSGATTINAGTLTLNGANTTTGATTLNGGTLNLGNATALSTGPLTIGAGGAKTINNTSGAAIVSASTAAQTWNDNFTVAGANDIDLGTGEVTVGGAGTDRAVTVSGTSTFAVGELKAPAHGLTKQGTGTLALSSTGVNVNGSNIAGTLNVAAGTVQINRTGAVNGDVDTGDLYVGGLAGTGTITNGAGIIRWLFVNQAAATTSTFNGLLENGLGGAGLGLFKDGPGTLTLGGASGMTDLVTIDEGTLNFTGGGSLASAVGYNISAGAAVFQVSSSSQVSGGTINIQSNGNGALETGSGSTARLEVSGDAMLFNPITLAPRNDTSGTDHIRSVSGSNTLNGVVTVTTGGNFSRIRSEAGSTLTLAGGITTTAGGNRNVYLQGAGNGDVSGGILDNPGNALGTISIFKEGAGTWTLSGFNSNAGLTAVFGGTLSITQADSIADLGDVSIFNGGTLNLTSGTLDTIDALYLNGAAQQPGVYGGIGSSAPLANQTALITGTGTLNVTRYDLPGDFDNNNIVDMADLTVWRNGMAAGNATGDTNGDGFSNGADFLLWQRFLGATNPAVAAVAAVPEPTSLVGAVFASIALAGFRRQRRA
jgi:autotransporter-associated beta strand protein